MTRHSPEQIRGLLLEQAAKTAHLATLPLCFGSCRIIVQADREELIARLRRYYSDFLVPDGRVIQGQEAMTVTALETEPWDLNLPWIVKQPDPGKSKIKEEYLDLAQGRMVRKRLTGMLFYFDRKKHLAVGPCLANDNQVINFINSRYIQWMLDKGCLLCHAAGVSLRGNGLALAGFSGMGKSTLALHMMNRGLDFVSNDRLLVERDAAGLRMHGVAKLPRVNPGTILGNSALAGLLDEYRKAAYARMDPEALWRLEHKHDVFLDECFGRGRFLSSARMAGLVVLNWKPKYPRTSLELVDMTGRRELLDTVIKSPGLFFLPHPELDYDFRDETYLEMFAGCAVFEARGGVDFDQVAEVCVHYLGQQGAM